MSGSAAELAEFMNGLIWLTCKGTRPHPGCGKPFYGNTRRLRFCPACAALDKQSSYVFVERRRERRQRDGLGGG